MSTTYISAELRRLVRSRASGLCEYCLIHEDDTFFGCEVDHIVSEKHGGATDASNLAYACLFCNRSKRSDVASMIPGTEELIRFYNPRTDLWSDHFHLESHDGVTILPVTDVGEATARIFGFNRVDRVLERRVLREAGRYPTPEARQRFHEDG